MPERSANEFDLQLAIERQLERLRAQTRRPCLLIYAPLWPAIIDGTVVVKDPDSSLFQAFAESCRRIGFDVLDLRPQLRASVREGVWPRGFHNGQFGEGHYNAAGNMIIARELARFLQRSGAAG